MPNKAKALPRLSRVQELLNYEPTTGEFSWKTSRRGTALSGVAGSVHKSTGYRNITIDGTKYRAHRLAWLVVTGSDPGELEIDHINRDRADNRFSNLRLATTQQNQRNLSLACTNTSGIKGVHWHKQRNKWRAKVQHKGRFIHVGCFELLEDAAAAVQKARRKVHGEFAS